MIDTPAASFSLGHLTEPVRDRLARWDQAEYGRRLWEKDPTLWSPDDVGELSDRLGWLDLPSTLIDAVDDLVEFAGEIRSQVDHVVLLGMGGSSLAPEVYQATFGNADGHPRLLVLDSTHPEAVLATRAQIDPRRTLFLVASKSGGTLETMSFFRYFWEETASVTDTPGRQFVALTDPGSDLEALASARGFRATFATPPDVGGRYSALTRFGLVPAALIGVDVGAVLGAAQRMATACGPDVPSSENPGLVLGAALGEAALAGRDKVTYVVSPALEAFPSWVEQLIAESTGKDDVGIVPVAGEPLGNHDVYQQDRLFVHVMVAGDDPRGQPAALEVLQASGQPVVRIVLDELEDIGAEFFRSEMAVAAAGSVLGIHPFNQPDVQIAKDLAKQAMSPDGLEGEVREVTAADTDGLEAAWDAWIGSLTDGDYISLHAYLPMVDDVVAVLARLQVGLRDRYRRAVTVGFGPRFLHSTGQLHKGGANNGVFLQIVSTPTSDVPVPETDFTFDRLVVGQSVGDYHALRGRDRRVLRVNVGADTTAGLDAIVRVAGV